MIRLQQRPFLGLLINPFGKTVRAMELDCDSLQIARHGKSVSLSLQALGAPPSLRKGIFGTTLSISPGMDEAIILRGAGHLAAREFSEGLKTAWVRFNLSAREKEGARLDTRWEGWILGQDATAG